MDYLMQLKLSDSWENRYLARSYGRYCMIMCVEWNRKLHVIHGLQVKILDQTVTATLAGCMSKMTCEAFDLSQIIFHTKTPCREQSSA